MRVANRYFFDSLLRLLVNGCSQFYLINSGDKA